MIYQVRNPNGQTEYFVESQDVANANAHVVCHVGSEADAVAKQKEYALAHLEQEAYRFSVAKEIVDGNNTTWQAVTDIDNDNHTGTYYVFNTFTGIHEQVADKGAVKARVKALQQQLVTENGFDGVTIVEKIPSNYEVLAPAYGQILGSIPVEIM